jgi:hypothetical protein
VHPHSLRPAAGTVSQRDVSVNVVLAESPIELSDCISLQIAQM